MIRFRVWRRKLHSHSVILSRLRFPATISKGDGILPQKIVSLRAEYDLVNAEVGFASTVPSPLRYTTTKNVAALRVIWFVVGKEGKIEPTASHHDRPHPFRAP